MKNFTERSLSFVSPSTKEVVCELPSEGVRVTVTRGAPQELPSVDGLPCVSFSPAVGVEGLEGVVGDIIVPLVVAEGLRALGYKYKGRVFTPQQLLFGPNREVIGAPGVIFHADISE